MTAPVVTDASVRSDSIRIDFQFDVPVVVLPSLSYYPSVVCSSGDRRVWYEAGSGTTGITFVMAKSVFENEIVAFSFVGSLISNGGDTLADVTGVAINNSVLCKAGNRCDGTPKENKLYHDFHRVDPDRRGLFRGKF